MQQSRTIPIRRLDEIMTYQLFSVFLGVGLAGAAGLDGVPQAVCVFAVAIVGFFVARAWGIRGHRSEPST